MVVNAELIKKLRQRDIAAFISLYDLYSPCLFGAIKKNIQADDKASVILEECFIFIWHHIHLYDEKEGGLLAWMVRITTRISGKAVGENNFVIPFSYVHRL